MVVTQNCLFFSLLFLGGLGCPEQVDMEDGDSIDAMLHQTGGYSAI